MSERASFHKFTPDSGVVLDAESKAVAMCPSAEIADIVRDALNAFDPAIHVLTASEAAAHPNPDQVRITSEPDISRAGDKHIKPCRGCDTPLLWAKHEKTLKVAPLVKAKAGETPNIIAYYDEGQDQWFYKIKGAKSEVRGTPEYVNHFSNCSRANDFKSAPKTEDEERAAAIK